MIHPVFSAPTWPQGPHRLLVSVLATHALTYLREEFDAPIPETVLAPLRNQSPDPGEFAEFHHITDVRRLGSAAAW